MTGHGTKLQGLEFVCLCDFTLAWVVLPSLGNLVEPGSRVAVSNLMPM